MVSTYGPKGFPYTYFKAQVYPIYLHRPFGFLKGYHTVTWDPTETRSVKSSSAAAAGVPRV